MVLELRSFRNTDILALCGVFNAHYHAAGLPYVLTPISLELCVLSKPYFTSEQLLIAEVDGSIHAFALLGLEPDQDCNSVDTSLATLCALCAHPNATDATVMELLQHASRSAQAMGSKRITFCPPPPSSAYFAGLVPGDGMIGVPESTFVRLAGSLKRNGRRTGGSIFGNWNWPISTLRWIAPKSNCVAPRK